LFLAIQRLVKLADNDKCKNCKCDSSSLKLDQTLLASMEVTKEDWTQALKALEEAKQKSAEDEKKADPYKRFSIPEKKIESEEGKLDENLGFTSVGGLDEQIENLRENIMFPFANKDSMKEWGIEPVRGIIFHGPPGTGKTLLAKALAAELSRLGKEKFSFFYHKGTDSYGPYVSTLTFTYLHNY
jgi:SpoVK/Ycf46/Vps4 family AAA+-type ATPase